MNPIRILVLKRNKIFILFILLIIILNCKDTILNEPNRKLKRYKDLFNPLNFHNIELVFSHEEWKGLIQDMKDYEAKYGNLRTGNYRKAKFIYNGPAGFFIIDDVGVRTRGHTTRTLPQDENGNFQRTHFNIKFNCTFNLEKNTKEYNEKKDRRFLGYRKLILKYNIEDNSQIRQLYCYDLINRSGVNTSRVSSANLKIDTGNKKVNFGIYTLIEPIDKSFLTNLYGKKSNDGNLYKCTREHGPATLELDTINNINNIGIRDWQRNYRPNYDLDYYKNKPDYADIINFIQNINTLNLKDLKEYLEKNFEVDKFIRYMAINLLIGASDDYRANGNNYYLYFNNNGKIDFFPYDYDKSLGLIRNLEKTDIYKWVNRAKEKSEDMHDYKFPLAERILDIKEYRERYNKYLEDFIKPKNRLFVYSDYKRKFNYYKKLYRDYLNNDIDKNERMIRTVLVESYFRERTRSVVNQLVLDIKEYEIESYFFNIKKKLRNFKNKVLKAVKNILKSKK